GSQRVAYFHELLVFPAKHRVFIAQLPCRYNLSRFQVLRISGIDHHLLVEDVVVFFTEDKLVDILAGQEVGISRIDDLDFLHHLAYDRLDVLVVDLHTLQTVYFLDFVHQVFLYGRRALDRQDIGRGDRPIRKLLTSLHEVIILNQDVLRQRHQVALLNAVARFDENLAVTPLDATVGYDAVDFAHNRRVRRISRLEQLRYPRQTARDVARLAHGSRNLCQHLSGFDLLSGIDSQVSPNRDVVCLGLGLSGNKERGVLGLVARFRDHLLAVTRLLIRLLLEGHAFDDGFVLHRAVEFRKDYGIVRIPEADFITLLNRVTVAYPQEGTVRHVVGNEYPLSFRIHQLDLTGSSHHHPCRVALCVGGFNEPNAFKFHDTIELRLDVGFDGNVGGSTPYVEGTQGKLCTRLADRLGGDNAHRFAGVYHFASRQIAAIALGAAS